MVYKRFFIIVILQVVILALTPALFFLLIRMDYMYITSYSLCAIWIGQIIYLIYYLGKTNRDLGKFLLSFKYKDSTLVFDEDVKNKSFAILYKSFNKIINAFGQIKIEKEKDYNFFHHTIQHIGIGILAFDQRGNIELSNDAFNKLFNIKGIQKLDNLDKIKPGFSNKIKVIRPGKQELIKLLINNEILRISIKCEEFIIEERRIKLVSFQNIKTEIEHGEVELWQKLIRILTHEILNSVSPVTLLSTSLINMYERDNKQLPVKEIKDKTVKNTLLGLHTIKKRSKGLSRFVEDYRDLTRFAPPGFIEFKVDELFKQIETLFNEELKTKGIKFNWNVDKNDQLLIADEKLIEQILINLVKNSVQAMEKTKNAYIHLDCMSAGSDIQITVSDNGSGIPDEIKDDIFIPFFSTKKNGSGIGLSLSRQIMRMHDGSISVVSEPNVSTVFSLKF